jgi:hypothetical protein
VTASFGFLIRLFWFCAAGQCFCQMGATPAICSTPPCVIIYKVHW